MLHENIKKWENAFIPQGVPDEAKESLEQVRAAYCRLAGDLQNLLPEGRYKALVKTHLEQSAMFATKCFTHEKT